MAYCVLFYQHTFLIKGKVHYYIGNCKRPVFSLGVSLNMHKITTLWKFELNRSSKLGENDERKAALLDEFVCFQIGIKVFYFYYFNEKLPIYITTLLQRESLSTMFYTINSSSIPVTESVFKIIFILSNYQTCSFPFSQLIKTLKIKRGKIIKNNLKW